MHREDPQSNPQSYPQQYPPLYPPPFMTSLVAPDQVSSGRARTRQSRRAGRSQNQQPVRREKKSGQRTSSSKQSKDTPCASRSEHSGRPPTVEPSWAAGSTRKMPLELSRRLRTGERPVALSLGGLGLVAFLWALKSGQYEDLDGASWRILDDGDGEGESSQTL